MVFQCITGVSLIPNIRYKYQHSSADMQNVSNLPKVSMGHISSDWMYKLVLKRWASISVVVNLKYFSFLFLLFTFLAVKLFHFFSQQSQNADASTDCLPRPDHLPPPTLLHSSPHPATAPAWNARSCWKIALLCTRNWHQVDWGPGLAAGDREYYFKIHNVPCLSLLCVLKIIYRG